MYKLGVDTIDGNGGSSKKLCLDFEEPSKTKENKIIIVDDIISSLQNKTKNKEAKNRKEKKRKSKFVFRRYPHNGVNLVTKQRGGD